MRRHANTCWRGSSDTTRPADMVRLSAASPACNGGAEEDLRAKRLPMFDGSSTVLGWLQPCST